MKLLLKTQTAALLKNGAASLAAEGGSVDHKPVVKFFGGGACTWLITEMAADGDTMFGLCDLGHGTPELGNVSLTELSNLRFRPFGLGVERDKYFTADKPLSAYSDEARKLGRINA